MLNSESLAARISPASPKASNTGRENAIFPAVQMWCSGWPTSISVPI